MKNLNYAEHRPEFRDAIDTLNVNIVASPSNRHFYGAFTMIKVIVQIAVAFAVLCAQIAYAQPTLSQLQSEMVSSWLVTVEGESRTRTLRIKGVAEKASDMFLLDAEYGWSDGRQTAVKAELAQNAQERKLNLTTQADSQIVASQTQSGIFTGTITVKNGNTKAISIARISEDELRLKVASAARPIKKPAADVPESCASFSGEWTGTWSQGGIGQYWLWVVEINSNCVAKFAYLSHSRPPVGFATVEIKDGALPIVNRSTGGTSIFRRHGNELWAGYSNPAGGTNNAAFEKVQ